MKILIISTNKSIFYSHGKIIFLFRLVISLSYSIRKSKFFSACVYITFLSLSLILSASFSVRVFNCLALFIFLLFFSIFFTFVYLLAWKNKIIIIIIKRRKKERERLILFASRELVSNTENGCKWTTRNRIGIEYCRRFSRRIEFFWISKKSFICVFLKEFNEESILDETSRECKSKGEETKQRNLFI